MSEEPPKTATRRVEDNSEQIRILQRLSPADKLKVAERLYWSARELKAAGLREQHPEWPKEQIERKVREIFLYARS
jgi:hypothetical protein